MNRHFQCPCGGTAWVTREAGWTQIQCEACGASVGGETLDLARQNWDAIHKDPRKKPAPKKRAPDSRP